MQGKFILLSITSIAEYTGYTTDNNHVINANKCKNDYIRITREN